MRGPENEFEAWFAGIAITDGWPIRTTVRFSPCERDVSTFARIVEALDGNVGPLRTDARGNKFGGVSVRGLPVEWVRDIPPLEPELLRHYVRGLIDGDGCVPSRQWPRVVFLWNHETQDFLGDFFCAAVAQLGFPVGKVQVQGKCTAVAPLPSRGFRHCIYADSAWFLPRKKELALR